MLKKTLSFLGFAFLAALVLLGATRQAGAQAEKASYPAMAPLDQYLIPEENSEIALARIAAPASISDGAEVMVLGSQAQSVTPPDWLPSGFPVLTPRTIVALLGSREL